MLFFASDDLLSFGVPVFGGKNIIHQGRPFFIIPMVQKFRGLG
jgi:hypothetical protein